MRHRKRTKGIAMTAAIALAAGSITVYNGFIPAAVSAQAADGTEDSGNGADQAMGRYLEEDIRLPEGFKTIEAMTVLGDGRLRICSYNEENTLVYADSSDGGKTWGEETSLYDLFGLDSGQYSLCYPKLSRNGEIFSAASDLTVQDEDAGLASQLFYADREGNTSKLELGEKMANGFGFSSAFTDRGTLLLAVLGNGVIEVDPKEGTVLGEYEKGVMLSYFFAAGNHLVTVSGDGIHYYDLESGQPEDNQQALTGQISSDPKNLELSGVGQYPVVAAAGEEEDSLFFVDDEGMYRYVFGGSVAEQVINGSLNSLSSPDLAFVELAMDTEGAFYLAVRDFGQGASTPARLIRYEYSADTPAVPDTELTVYSLTDNTLLRQAAAAFQKENPNIYLNLQTGMTGDDAVTDTDAIKALNTEIMAGKGPDILILDGIPEDTYVENGMLEDLSGILSSVEGGILENIKNAYTEEDGSVYCMPLRFGVPMLQGKAEDVEQVSDLKTLADVLESHQGEYGSEPMKIPMGLVYTPELLLSGLADACSPAWFNEDGTLKEEAVSEYLEQANRIYQICAPMLEEMFAGASQEELASMSEYDRTMFGVSTSSMSLFGGYYTMGTGGLYSPDNLALVYSTEQEDPSLESVLWNGQAENVFIPCSVIGISAKAQEKEAAETFVKFLFDQTAQEMAGATGLPVNQTAYDGEAYWDLGGSDGVVSVISSSNNQTGETTELEVRQPSEEEIQKIREMGKTLTVPSRTNEIILTAVKDAGARYLRGEIGLEEAARAAIQEVNLYLSE